MREKLQQADHNAIRDGSEIKTSGDSNSRIGELNLRGSRFSLSDYHDMVQRKNRSKA